jgi:ATP-dependent Clp protease adaptor protein ClpS
MTSPPDRQGRADTGEPYDLPDDEEPFNLPEEVEPYELPPEPVRYDLIIINDDTHTHEYVAGLLEEVFGYTWAEGYALAWEIHNHGRVVVFTGSRQRVDRKRARVLAYGPDPWLPWSTGPLTVEVRPARST